MKDSQRLNLLDIPVKFVAAKTTKPESDVKCRNENLVVLRHDKYIWNNSQIGIIYKAKAKRV